MKVTFKNSHPQMGERTLQIDLTDGGNYIGITNTAGHSILMLSDDQLDELRLFLNKWKEQ